MTAPAAKANQPELTDEQRLAMAQQTDLTDEQLLIALIRIHLTGLEDGIRERSTDADTGLTDEQRFIVLIRTQLNVLARRIT